MSSSNLDSVIATQLQQQAITGGAVALTSAGRMTYHRAFGSHPRSSQAVVPTTLFQAASLTKPLFAYAVLQLCDSGQLDLDIPLSHVYVDPAITSDAARHITARHVLV